MASNQPPTQKMFRSKIAVKTTTTTKCVQGTGTTSSSHSMTQANLVVQSNNNAGALNRFGYNPNQSARPRAHTNNRASRIPIRQRTQTPAKRPANTGRIPCFRRPPQPGNCQPSGSRIAMRPGTQTPAKRPAYTGRIPRYQRPPHPTTSQTSRRRVPCFRAPPQPWNQCSTTSSATGSELSWNCQTSGSRIAIRPGTQTPAKRPAYTGRIPRYQRPAQPAKRQASRSRIPIRQRTQPPHSPCPAPENSRSPTSKCPAAQSSPPPHDSQFSADLQFYDDDSRVDDCAGETDPVFLLERISDIEDRICMLEQLVALLPGQVGLHAVIARYKAMLPNCRSRYADAVADRNADGYTSSEEGGDWSYETTSECDEEDVEEEETDDSYLSMSDDSLEEATPKECEVEDDDWETDEEGDEECEEEEVDVDCEDEGGYEVCEEEEGEEECEEEEVDVDCEYEELDEDDDGCDDRELEETY